MENTEDDEDLKLVQASAGLLADLQSSLPKLLWRHESGPRHGRVHTHIRQRDLHHIVKLIEPFQGEPQLLDARLKYILPPIVEAYLEYIALSRQPPLTYHIDFQTAACTILYTLCKVRGHKVIVGFFNNEPRYLEPVLSTLEQVTFSEADAQAEWQVPYVLLLWLSHLFLAPFDLSSISADQAAGHEGEGFDFSGKTPALTIKAVRIGMHYLPMSTKAQDAAAAMLVRLATRPDMQKLQLGDMLVDRTLQSIHASASSVPGTVYDRLGPLRFLAGICASADHNHLIPNIYRACEKLARDQSMSLTASNAVANKITIKIFRCIATLSVRSASGQGPILGFLETSSVLEDVIDYFLHSLGNRDTPVRYAAAKAISLLILEMTPDMGQEVVQAILESFREDMPRDGAPLDFRTVNALKWHGLTLALAHILFKRTASPEQLPDIVNTLASALQFEQRTTTGSTIGANVRDAANFGIWSLSRRYTTDELRAVDASALHFGQTMIDEPSVINKIAVQLILSACLDPAGNIRRGSSAALQELVGRHPDQIRHGIALVQILDYQAVGLRRRAIVDIARRVGDIDYMYRDALTHSLFGWRGLGSADVYSRDAAACSMAGLSLSRDTTGTLRVIEEIMTRLVQYPTSEAEALHGLFLALSYTLDELNTAGRTIFVSGKYPWIICKIMTASIEEFSGRVLRSALPSAIARLVAAVCCAYLEHVDDPLRSNDLPSDSIDTLTDRILARFEETVLETTPKLVRALFALKQRLEIRFDCIEVQILCGKVSADASKTTMNGAGRAIALGALAALLEPVTFNAEQDTAAVTTLTKLVSAVDVDWRVIGVRSLQIVVDSIPKDQNVNLATIECISTAVHRAMNDYTIDERGDVGSLVRLQGISCASSVLSSQPMRGAVSALTVLRGDIIRLSLEKLDRVRLQAARCRKTYLVDLGQDLADVTSVSTYAYFCEAFRPLSEPHTEAATVTALFEGCVSCAGVSAERILQASRLAIANIMNASTEAHLNTSMSAFSAILKDMLVDGSNTHPALEVLSFLLDMQIPQRLMRHQKFNWRHLLSTVQKSHHKSNDVAKIMAAVRVYRGLADVAALKGEVLKKLVNMLKTNPYPRVRSTVAETLWVLTRENALRVRDWTRSPAENFSTVQMMAQRYALV